ncbi:Uncharacterised protein [Pseudomonas fluorescens]|uniref:Uncharacterized protein n=1 Tax=Pseudomonas fluorescens TaxID=294 RepID=A0A379I5C2_PSEFL|nr:hypothetical protein [Pseudomonas fluorescens]AIG04099.1 hypothetical protein HZ99_18630 [Pseudomonas fluorescens]SUD27291.1 Uncharacterised protein [Pseudomonas fluorescens]
MNRGKSKFKLFFLLIIYCIVLFVFLAFVGTFMAISIHYFKSGVLDFTKIDALRLVFGALAYAIPVAIGVWVLYLLKERKSGKANDSEAER